MDSADIAIIGSGAAASTTLIALFVKLLEEPPQKKLHVTIIEKHPEFFKGIPYGSRSSINALTITSVADFVSVEKEKKLFNEWLKLNQDEWVNYYRLNGGLAAKLWLENNLALVEKEQWSDVYLPRFVFGIYMQNRLLELLQQVEDRQLAKINLIQAEAIAIKLNASADYEVTLAHPDKKTTTIKAKKLVVAIGSAPVKENGKDDANEHFVYINDLYYPSVDDNLKTVQSSLQKATADYRNILIIGSNASCIELLYLLNNRPDILIDINKIITISRAGIMPYHISEAELDDYPTLNLNEVKSRDNYDVHTLFDATKKDIAAAIQDTAIIPHLNKIIGYTIELLQVLDEQAKRIFFSVYGPQITKLIRRSGPAYKGASDNLIGINKLQTFKGNFLSLETGANGGVMNYIGADNVQQKYPLTFKAIINCSGSNKLRESSSPLLYNLINNKVCDLTISGEGILVNEKFEAAPNLYIMGPLLAGNMNKLIHFWHLENVSRLLYLAPFLANELVK